MIYILYLLLLLILTFSTLLLFSNFYLYLILNEKRKTISFKWLFLSLGSDWRTKKLTFYLFSQRILSKKIEKKKVTKEKKTPKKKTKGKLDFLVLWKEKTLLIKVIKIVLIYFKNLLRKIKFDRFSLDTKIATPDPALTGILYGGISGVVHCFGLSPFGDKIRIEPDFETTMPGAKVELGLETKARNVFYYTSKMFFSLPKIKMIKLFKKAYTKRR